MSAALGSLPQRWSRCGPLVACRTWKGCNGRSHRCKFRQNCDRRAFSAGQTCIEVSLGRQTRCRRALTPQMNLCLFDPRHRRPTTTIPVRGRGTQSGPSHGTPVHVSRSARWSDSDFNVQHSRISIYQMSTPTRGCRKGTGFRDTGTLVFHR